MKKSYVITVVFYLLINSNLFCTGGKTCFVPRSINSCEYLYQQDYLTFSEENNLNRVANALKDSKKIEKLKANGLLSKIKSGLNWIKSSFTRNNSTTNNSIKIKTIKVNLKDENKIGEIDDATFKKYMNRSNKD